MIFCDFQQFLTTLTYNVRRFLPYNEQCFVVILNPLPTLKSDIINGSSLNSIFLRATIYQVINLKILGSVSVHFFNRSAYWNFQDHMFSAIQVHRNSLRAPMPRYRLGQLRLTGHILDILLPVRSGHSYRVNPTKQNCASIIQTRSLKSVLKFDTFKLFEFSTGKIHRFSNHQMV